MFSLLIQLTSVAVSDPSWLVFIFFKQQPQNNQPTKTNQNQTKQTNKNTQNREPQNIETMDFYMSPSASISLCLNACFTHQEQGATAQ